MTLQHDYRGLYKIDQTIFFFEMGEKTHSVLLSSKTEGNVSDHTDCVQVTHDHYKQLK